MNLAGFLASGETDPRTASFKDDRPEVQALFEAALEARLPRKRELKAWEPQRLNERHLAMVMARAAGFKQRQIAQAFGATDSNVSIILNHPDAETLLAKLQSMRSTVPTAIEERLAALAEPAVSALELALTSEEPDELKTAFRRAPLAFRLLELNGHGRPKVQEHKHQHSVTLEASAGELQALAAALRESREIPEPDFVILEGNVEEQLLAPAEPPAEPPPEGA